MTLDTFLEALLEANSIEDVWQLELRFLEPFGFDRAIYGCTRFLTSTSIGDPQDTVLLSNLGPDYLEGFVNGGLYFHAPMTTWARSHEGACSWSVLSDMAEQKVLTEAELSVIRFNHQHGVRDGYTVSFKALSQRTKGAIALIGNADLSQDEVDSIWMENQKDLWLATSYAHLRIMSLPHMTGRPLTARQREVLQWVGDGKTTQEIADVMNLTPATVEKHLRLAREALDVATTAQAIAKASAQNQMFIL
ncbi:MAG: helix-turn-helix transcriptional regulator, partial [Shimia sp.]